MPRQHRRPAVLSGRVFRGRQTIRLGLLTLDELRSPAWIRLRHDVYADARLDLDHELACRAALARLPGSTVVAGASAAYLHGVTHAATFTDDVHVITPTTVRLGTQKRLRVHHLDLEPEEITNGSLPTTTPARTAWDVARWLDPADAVPILDTLLRRALTNSADLTTQLAQLTGQRGWRKASLAYRLADPGAQSPAESRLRVRLMLEGLPRPVTQCPVPISSTLVLHPDLGWPEWRVAVEYDGQWHGATDQLHRDRQRLNQLTTAKWTVLHATAERLRSDFPRFAAEVRAALTAKGWRPGPTPRH